LKNKIKSMRLGGIDYKLDVKKGLFANGRQLDGQISFGDTTIYVDERLSDQAALLTILHEAVHAMFTHLGLEMSAEVVLSESFVDAIAYQLYSLMRDNPGILKAVMAAK
jgi:hypothetical protein